MNPEIEMILRLLLATALGAGIGYQRERAKKPAGLRTHILIALGAALFTVASVFGFGNGVDPSRVAAGVVAGIGFIGAGVIFRTADRVAGLTTAASIWVTASVGLAAGAGMYLVAFLVAVVAAVVLMLPKVRG
ncbi:MAG TPA: MgtC/SapB family protein [Dehalococcoidia bacterium]|nr:MgtC/SapB family protein [Dehalococcoidia bacterium]